MAGMTEPVNPYLPEGGAYPGWRGARLRRPGLCLRQPHRTRHQHGDGRRRSAPAIADITESRGTSFAGHEIFEASSIHRIGDTYYLVYSDVDAHNLAYATSSSPTGGFTYRGALISNGDIGFDGRGIMGGAMAFGNNHGCVEQINGRWYVFYHRHTDGRHASRQACAEPIELRPDGTFSRARLSSSGLHAERLPGTGTYRRVPQFRTPGGHRERRHARHGERMSGRHHTSR
ncbi:hypothetical protein AB0M34_25675 [Nocardia sp. NPDC050193]